jgi:hypothetical protein
MTYKLSKIAVGDEDSSIQVLGETGGTIVHVFPNGKASIKKGKRKDLTFQADQSVQNKDSAPPNPSFPQSSLRRNHNGSLQCPPSPPPLHPGCLAFSVTTLSDAEHSASSNHQAKSLKDLERYLVQHKLITSTQLEVARYDMSASAMSLEEILIARGWITQEAIDQFHHS